MVIERWCFSTMYPDVFDEMVGRMFISKFVLNGNLFNNFQSYILFILYKNILNGAKIFKSISQHHGKVQIWLAFWNLCSGTAANSSKFCGLLSHFSFCWTPPFIPVPKQTFYLLTKALIYVNGNINLPIELISLFIFISSVKVITKW